MKNLGLAHSLQASPFRDDALAYYPPDLRQVALSVEASGSPIGEAFRYNNYHMLLEGLIVERAGAPKPWQVLLVGMTGSAEVYDAVVDNLSERTLAQLGHETDRIELKVF